MLKQFVKSVGDFEGTFYYFPWKGENVSGISFLEESRFFEESR